MPRLPPPCCRHCQGADAPLSGLVAMLAALRVLRNAAAASGGAERYAKRIVFLALAGEAWGYMGSRRLLYDADSGSNSTQGLRMQLVEQVSGDAHRQLLVAHASVRLSACMPWLCVRARACVRRSLCTLRCTCKYRLCRLRQPSALPAHAAICTCHV